jgi:hypothetical protein
VQYTCFFIFSVFLQDHFLRKKVLKIQYYQFYLKQITAVIVMLIVAILYFNQFAYRHFYKTSEVVNKLVVDIQKNTLVSDKIYVSYADAWIYVISKRKSFSRYFYPNAVLQIDFDDKDRVTEMLNEYKKSPPSLLVVWKSSSFEEAFSIKKMREILANDYYLKINETK